MNPGDRAPAKAFTHSYVQPDEYHFCQDSVIAPRLIASYFKDRPIAEDFRALDVCSGCGVLGFELAHHEPRLKRFDFLEIQDVFREPFLENLEITGHGDDFHLIQQNYSILNTDAYRARYDLIIGNPPYFMPTEGRLSPSQVNNRCRFFLDSDLLTLVKGVANALKPSGEAYLLIKSGAGHGRDSLRDLSLNLAGLVRLQPIADVRGTPLVRITLV